MQDIDRIFSNITDIYEFSVTFLGLLDAAIEVADEGKQPAIGECFEEMAEVSFIGKCLNPGAYLVCLSQQEKPRSISSLSSMIVHVKVVLKKIVVGDSCLNPGLCLSSFSSLIVHLIPFLKDHTRQNMEYS